MPYVTQQMVLEFHKHCKLSIGNPAKPDISVDQALRVSLIQEEFEELLEALEEGNLVKVADALGDLQYVINGAAVSWGIDLGPVFGEIHRSNMTKKPGNTRTDGKILKDADYVAPDIQAVLDSSASELRDGWDLEEWDLEEVSHKIMSEATEYAFDFSDEEPTQPTRLTGRFTSYGAFLFDCVGCGRTHAVSGKLGSRGGVAPTGKAECMCGKAYLVVFDTHSEPQIQVTTIEDLRKAQA